MDDWISALLQGNGAQDRIKNIRDKDSTETILINDLEYDIPRMVKILLEELEKMSRKVLRQGDGAWVDE